MSCHYQCVCIHGREITCTCVLLCYYNKPCANCVRVTTGGVCVYTYNNGGKLNSEMLPECFLLPRKKGKNFSTLCAEITISCFAASEPGSPSLKTVPTPLIHASMCHALSTMFMMHAIIYCKQYTNYFILF